ncbi:MAG: acyl-CoA dehydrogenase [Rhodospirillaceae bacterium]|nr:acyl-CoA dehydrogenase [Rhodospirillaceae bacterium]|tara:strand:+ start:6032 stop:6871 length:840 start_codon:yes stop_codon:yes gene_type:complete
MSDQYEAWIGKQSSTEALVTAYQADALTATLDRDDPAYKEGDAIPPGWHLFYIREVVKLRDTAEDGHPKRGDFLPPIDLPRRMWAGTQATYHKPIHVGETIRNVTTIESVTPKVGKTGQLVFLKLKHEISGEDGIATTEIQDVVYREEAKPDAVAPEPPPAPGDAVWKRTIQPSPVLLFRYSALTMNSHRIHYDRTYVTEIEKYPGLLVHGPLTFTLLLDLFRRENPDSTLKSFSVRAVSPIYDTHDFTVEGTPGEAGEATLWALNHDGRLAMSAKATF